MRWVNKSLSNYEIVTLAAYLLGGGSLTVDIEDIAIKANEIAPGRFAWRKYPNQINIDHVGSALREAKKPKNGGLLLGSSKEGWLLTEQGLAFAEDRAQDLSHTDLAREALSPKERSWRRNERIHMLSEAAFLKSQSLGIESVTSQEAESFFRVNDYVTGRARERKLTRILNTFGDDPELGQVVRQLAAKVRRR